MHKHEKLMRTVLDWCAGHDGIFSGKTVLCAVSGGRDSVALLHLLLRLSGEIGFSVVAAHYHHRLRRSADEDEALVRRLCGEWGVPLCCGSGDVRAYARENGTSIEDAARTLRYAFLADTAQEYGADLIATAHHRQDNAETALLHLLRGSGLRGLGGIAPVRGNVIRPLLMADRADIDDYIKENGLPYAEDETNQDTAYLRNRVRLELLPLLEEIAPGCTERIAAASARIRADEAFLQEYTEAILPVWTSDAWAEVPVSLLREQPQAIAARLVRAAARHLGGELTGAQTDAALQLRSGGCLSLGGTLRAARSGKTLRFYRVQPAAAPMPLAPGEQRWGEWVVTVRKTRESVCEDERTVILCGRARSLTIAAWDGGGRLAVENGRRTVKRLLADRGFGAAQREDRPAVFADGALAAVFGAGTDLALRAVPGEENIVITLENGV